VPFNDNYSYVSDLTLDANWGGGSVTNVVKAQGISINAAAGAIERVRVINFGGEGLPTDDTTWEVYPITWAIPPGTTNGHAMIQGCIVEGHTKGGDAAYGSSILMFNLGQQGSSAIVRGNMVVDADDSDAYQATGATIVEGNVANHDAAGSSFDTFNGTNTVFWANHFVNVGFGFQYGNTQPNSYGWDSLIFQDNTIELNDTFTNGLPGDWGGTLYPVGIRLHGNITNVVIKNNIVKVRPDLASAGKIPNWTGITILNYANNTVVSNAVVDGNVIGDELGNSIASYDTSIKRVSNDSGLSTRNNPLGPNSVTAPNNSNYTVTDGDFTSGLQSHLPIQMGAVLTNDYTLTIPAPSGYAGHSLTLQVMVRMTNATSVKIPIAVVGGGSSTTGSYTAVTGGTNQSYFYNITSVNTNQLYSPSIYTWPSGVSGSNYFSADLQLYSDGACWYVHR
jgi:hypothetical protein